MNERTIKIKTLIKDEVCMGTYGLVELELLEIEKENELLRNKLADNQREMLISLLMDIDECYTMHIRQNAEKCVDEYLKKLA